MADLLVANCLDGGRDMHKPFTPQLVCFGPNALEYPLGKELKEKFDELGIETRFTTSHNQIRDLPGKTDA